MTEIKEERCDVLAEVFPDDGDTWEHSEKLHVVVKELDRLKLDLKNYLKNDDSNITELMKETESLCREGRELVEELESCEREIEQETMSEVLKSIEHHDTMMRDLDKVNFSLNIIYDVMQCSMYLQNYEDSRRTENFSAAIEWLADMKDFMSTPGQGFSQLTLYNAFKTSLDLHWNNLVQELSRQFDHLLSWKVTAEVNKRCVASIHFHIDSTQREANILLALHKCKELHPKIISFARFLLKEILHPLVNHECIIILEYPELIQLRVNRETSRPKYEQVMSNIFYLMNILNDKLDIDIDSTDNVLCLIGNEVGVEFGEVLMKDCLAYTIPYSIAELEDYHNVTEEAMSLQNLMQEIGFFPKDNFTVMNYAEDLDASFAQNTSQHFLDQARDIMMKDLSASMSIGVESVPVVEEKAVAMDASVDEAIQMLEKALPKSLYYFPRCMISKTTQELLDLIHSIMEQVNQCSDLVCKRLYMTARLIFDLYEAVMPYHHENYLLTIPQYVALFHNNCMYLAHNLLTFGEKWAMHVADRNIDYPICFLDLVPKLRNLGYKHLTVHLQQQRKQILDNIRSSDLNCIVVKDVLGENAEQAIRQCLRQLQLLKNVWIGVFPPNVFKSLMACLVNMFIEEIIHRVCTVEDISAEMANQLTDMYTIVVKKAPNLFQKESDLTENVKCWVKLREVILVLGGSLKDIEKRWCDGSGPLALHFRVEELRSLIKALFQNTQFRANLLAKIK